MAIKVENKRCGCCRVLFGLPAECVIITLTLSHMLMSALELLIHLEIVQVPDDSSGKSTSIATTTTTPVSPNVTSESSPYDPGGNSGGSSACDTLPTHPSLVYTVRVLQYATLALSALFLVEIFFKFVYLQKKFVKDVCQVFDLMVVVISLGVEVTYLVLHEKLVCVHPAVEVASFIIVLRLWRIPLACNVRKVAYKRRMEDEIRYLRQTKCEADAQCKQLSGVVRKQEKQLQQLRKQLHLLDGGVYTGNDQTDKGVTSNGKVYSNGGLRGSAATILSGDEKDDVIARDGGETDYVAKYTASVAFTADTGDKPSHDDLSRQDSDVNSKNNDSGIDAKDSFRSDIESNGYAREFKGEDEVFAGDSDGSETPVPGHRTIQQVKVQIEEPSRQKQLPSLTRSRNGSIEDVVLRRRPSDHFVPYFENAAYDADGDDDEDLDASRTYRSADGVPMTEL